MTRGKNKYMARHGLSRLQIDVPEELKDKLKARGEDLKAPVSQLATMLLEWAWSEVEAGRLRPEDYLEPARSPLFEQIFNLDRFRDELKKGSQ